MTHDPQPTPAVEAAARRRRELREALVDLEDAIASPSSAREAWRAEVARNLASLAQAFEDHVVETEGDAGLYDEMVVLAPHLNGKARRLRNEHAPIAAAIAEAAARLATPLPPDAEIATLRGEFQRLMNRIMRHRQHGADLVWEAYTIDIGAAG